MNIGIDIDGTINENFSLITSLGCKHFKKNVPMEKWQWDMSKAFEVSPQEVEDFWTLYEKELYETPGPKTDAVEYINKLDEKHKIVIITARSEEYRDLTEKWLKTHGIFHDELKMTYQKREACNLYNIDVMVEDAPVFLDICNDIPVLLFNYPYNKDENHSNLIRVDSWQEVYNIICQWDAK